MTAFYYAQPMLSAVANIRALPLVEVGGQNLVGKLLVEDVNEIDTINIRQRSDRAFLHRQQGI